MTKKVIWRSVSIAAVVAVAAAPVIARAPEPTLNLPRDVRTLDEALNDCLGCRLEGWALVDYATALVNQKFTRYSLWHLWETSGQAFKNSRGFSDQYNLALARLLTSLGFKVRPVHARHVRFDDGRNGWSWHRGHTWLQVTHAGQTLDVCAGLADHRAGRVRFRPLSEVHPYHPWTVLGTRLVLAVPVSYQVWKSWLTGRPTPGWLYRGFYQLPDRSR